MQMLYLDSMELNSHEYWNGVLGRGCNEEEISEEQRLFTEWGQGIQWMKALVSYSTGKAIQWRGFGHSVNRRTLWNWNLPRSSPSQISAHMVIELKKDFTDLCLGWEVTQKGPTGDTQSLDGFARIRRFSRVVSGFPNWTPSFANRASGC